MEISHGTAAVAASQVYEVRDLDLSDDAALQAWHGIAEEAERFERPWATVWTFEEFVIQVRDQDESARFELSGAFDGGRMVGAGLRIVPLLDNRDKVYAAVYVVPRERRRGIGGAVVEHLVSTTRADGRDRILIDAGVPGTERDSHPYTTFARKHGFSMASVEVHRQLDLPLPEERLDAMQQEAAPYHADYRLETYVDTVPDEVVESYCYLVNQLAVDAPTGDIEFEAEAHDPHLQRRHEARQRAMGRSQITTLALTAEGEAVAVTDLVVPAGDMPKVYQWATLVRRDHRGHHLGAAVKLQNLRALQQRHPERTEIHTSNEESNDVMIGINERLGFRVVELCPEFLLELG